MRLKHAIFAACLAAAASQAPAQVVINELMQSNIDCIMDDLNDFPDAWVELYNSGSDAVSLQGYRLSMDDDFASAFALPAVEIPAGGYALVYCDKVGQGMHADFRLDSGKCALYLFSPDGQKADGIDKISKQPAPNIAYGRKTDAADKWGYMLTPTPGMANKGGQSKTILSEVAFSQPGGVWNYPKTMYIELSLAEDSPEGSYIIYTLDGTEPTENNGTKYDAPITVTANTVIRAKAFCKDCISIRSSVNSYIFLGRDMGTNVISIVTDEKYLYDDYIGIFATGHGGEGKENFRYDWRRPINLEMFDGQDEPAVLNQLCETRVQGGYTRINPLKSLAVYANKRFGTKRFDYEFWPNDKPGITDNKSFILRNGGNDFSGAYIRDPLIQRVIGRNTDCLEWQGYAPAVIFINGKYHGMLAIRERSSEDNIYSNYDGLEDIDMFENWDELKAGDRLEHDRLVQFIKSEHSLDEWNSVINLHSYCALMAINYWIYNTDFPNNNTVMWRNRIGDDSRWRFLVKDCDFGLGIYGARDNAYKNFGDYMNTGNDEESGFPGSIGHSLWRSLMKCPEFRTMLADHLIAYTGDFLTAITFDKYITEILEEQNGEQKLSDKKWNWWSNYENNVEYLNEWAAVREKQIPGLIRNTFALGEPVNIKVNNKVTPYKSKKMVVKYCDVPLTVGRLQGVEYVGREIRVEAEHVAGWKVKIGNEEKTYDSPAISLPITGTEPIEINGIPGEPAGVGSAAAEPAFRIDGACIYASEPVAVCDLWGRLVGSGQGQIDLPAKGVYIVSAQGKQPVKVVY